MTKSAAEPKPVVLGRYRYSKWRWRALVRGFDAFGSVAIRAWRSVRSRPVVEAPRRILVVQLDHMGDALLTSPLLPRLAAAYPGAAVDVLASPSNREVFEADPHVRSVRLAERNWFERRRARWALASAVWSLGRSLRGQGYDLGIDVRGDLLTVLVLAMAGIPRRVGWAMGGGGFLLTDVADWVRGRHEVDSRLALLDTLGIAPEPGDPARVSVGVTDRDRARVARLLRDAGFGRRRRPLAAPASRRLVHAVASATTRIAFSPAGSTEPQADPSYDDPDDLHAGRFGAEAPLLAVHLGAGTAAKRWPARHWSDLIGRFLADGWRVVAIGGVEDAAPASAIAARPGLIDWTGRLALTESAALLERADLFIGSDSGPAHLAACAGVPSVILFSGTNLHAQWRPWSRRSLVLRHRVACRPCHHKTCPLADHPCMAGLTPDRVYKAARRWWSRIHRSESPHVPI